MALLERLWGRRSVLALPIIAVVTFLVLVLSGISGTSSGAFYSYLYGTRDPHIIVGTDRGIRSDEWLVATPATIGQVQSGFHPTNHSYAGGQDMTLNLDVPFTDWPVAFRPESWGFAVLPLDQSMAWKWWAPGLVALLGTYLLSLTIAPRRRVLAGSLAVSMLFAPMVQWWWLPGYTNAIGGVTIATAAALRLRVSSRRRDSVLWGIAMAWGLVTLVLTLYPPYIVAAILPALAIVIGRLASDAWSDGWRTLIRPVIRLGAAGAGAVVLFGVFAVQHHDALKALSDTDYPGARVQPTGASSVARTMGGLFSGLLQHRAVEGAQVDLVPFGGNQSEASAFVLVGLFLVPLVIAQAVVARRQGLVPDLPGLLLVGVVGVMLVDGLVPHQAWLAKVTGLYLVPPGRLAIGLGLACLLLIPITVVEAARLEWRPPRWSTIVWGAVVLAGLAVEVRHVQHSEPLLGRDAGIVTLTVIVMAVSVGLLGRSAVTGAVVLAALTVVLGAGVNPLSHGQLDLRTTAVGRAITSVDEASPGGWVGTAGVFGDAFLVESGVKTYTGVFDYPIFSNWTDLDPTGAQHTTYNRFAHVQFSATATELTNPTPDQVVAPLEACGTFAQHNLKHVLTETAMTGSCVRLARTVPIGVHTYLIYDIVPSAS